MQLFIDKYQPCNFNDVGFGQEANDKLVALARHKETPHILLKGYSGAGKRARIMLYLQEKFGPDVYKMHNYQITVKVPNKKLPKILDVTMSPYHYQINPSAYGVYDRILIQNFMEQTIQSKLLKDVPFKIVVIENTDSLTYEAQQSLRRTLETRAHNCRFIFLDNQVGHLIDPIYSRCIIINVASPNTSQMQKILTNIIVQEKLKVSMAALRKIIKYSGANLPQALNTLQRFAITKPEALTGNDLIVSDERQLAAEIVGSLVKAKDLTIFDSIRKMINKLFVNNLTSTQILKMIFECALERIPKTEIETIHNICNQANQCDNTIRMGGKYVYHIEAFCLWLFKEIKKLMIKRAKQKPTTISKTPSSKE